jgi:hypothetical protein
MTLRILKWFTILICIVFAFLAILAIASKLSSALVIDLEFMKKMKLKENIELLFSLCAFFPIILAFIFQAMERHRSDVINNFFKMLDFHVGNVNQLKISNIKDDDDDKAEGKRCFVIFKMQIIELLKLLESINEEMHLRLTKREIADIAYYTFYYGCDNRWEEFYKNLFKRYHFDNLFFTTLMNNIRRHNLKLGRTNQTSLSNYYRNMYRAVVLIHRDRFLKSKDKQKYIKILRAQLSNPELYVFFFNLLSRFGSKWILNDLVIKYELIRNIPEGYLGEDYNPKDYFKMVYEYEEIRDFEEINASEESKWSLFVNSLRNLFHK